MIKGGKEIHCENAVGNDPVMLIAEIFPCVYHARESGRLISAVDKEHFFGNRLVFLSFHLLLMSELTLAYTLLLLLLYLRFHKEGGEAKVKLKYRRTSVGMARRQREKEKKTEEQFEQFHRWHSIQ